MRFAHSYIATYSPDISPQEELHASDPFSSFGTGLQVYLWLTSFWVHNRLVHRNLSFNDQEPRFKRPKEALDPIDEKNLLSERSDMSALASSSN